MTTGESEETGTCGRQERVRGNTEPCRSVTALSTIAIQAGRSQLVVSVLRSGSLVHLQLVQVHPGLCVIGSNQEENQTMIQDQLQLMDKLKQHEKEALAVVKKGRQTEQERKWREEEVMELKRSQKIQEEDRVSEAMVTSLSEGWSLLLRLLERRQEVLMLASDFYRQTVEFSLSIDRVEALQIRPDDDKLTDVQLTYDSMRRDLLGKSLQVLASSSALLQKLKQLQRTEALQRRGGVLQDQEKEEGDEESSQCSRGVVLRLEELVESLQDRRRRADQAVRLQLGFINYPDSARPAGPEGWSLSVDKIQSEPISADHMDPQSCSRTGSRSEDARNSESSSLSHLKHESTTELKPRFKLDVKPESQSEETRDMEPAFRSEETRNLKSPSSSDLMPQSRSEVQPGSKLRTKPRLILEEIKNQSGFRLKLKAGSRSDLKENCKSEEIQDHQPESRLKETRDLQVPGSRSVQTTDVESVFRLQEPRNSEEGSRPDSKSESRSGETEERQPGSISDIKHKSTSDLKSGSNSEKTRSVKHGSRSDLQSETMLEKIRNFDSGSRTEMKPRTILDLKTESRSETKLLLLDEQPRSRLENTVNSQSKSTVVESKDLQTGSTSNVQLESGSNLKPESRSEEIRDPQSSKISVLRLRSRSEQTTDAEPGFRSEEHRNLESESRSDPQPGSRLREITQDLQSEFKSVKTMPLQLVSPSGLESESKSEMKPRSVLNLKTESRSETKQLQLDVQPRSGSEKTVDLQSESTAVKSKDLQRGSRSNVQLGSNLKTKSRSEEAKNLQPGFKLNQMPGLRSEELRNLESGSRSDIKSDSRSDLSPDGGETSNSQPGSRSSETRNLQPGSQSEADDVSLSEVNRKQEETRQLRPAMTSSGQVEVESTLGKESQSGGDQAVLTNQEQQLLSSCEHLLGKVWCWVQQGSSVLSNSSDTGRQLCEAQHTLNTHLKLHTQAEAIGHDAETLKQILDQIQVLRTDSTIVGSQPPSDPTRRLSPLKALTQQLKTGRHNRPNTTQDSPPAADSAGTSSSELATQVDVVLKALQSLNRKIDINLQLLKPHVTFFQAAQQVEEEMEELREVYRKRPQEKEAGTGDIKKCVDTRWQEMMQRLAATQELGKKHIQAVTMVSGSGLDVQSVVSVVQQMIENLNRTRQEINELQIYQQIQVQQQKEDMTFYRKYQEKLLKTLQDLNCVSELLDSCTVTDLGSDLQTSRLMEHFSQARPHFSQLDSEVEYVMKSWETMRGVQERLEVKEVKGESVKEKDLSELLKLQKTVKEKIQHSELILDLTNSFHLTAKQLEALLHSDTVSSSTGSSGVCGSREDQQQIQNLFKTASVLKTDICTAVTHSGWTSFRLEQLEVRLQSLDSLCVSWLNEMARREEKLHREQLIRQLNDDISQLRDSFKELKKRFSNLKFNYLKRNDRTRNMKAVRNQLQQVELYEEKLQVLKKKLQGVTTRLGSEVKDGGVAREVEDAINELQRQMGEFERSVCEHKKTLDMTCRLQQAMEEYQFWCEEASATIARVGKFSSECRSTEAVAVLYRQFEKFVWPTVPQQEERISQITELAVRLHGAEEGRRYIEKTVSKHSEMVESIRELSDGLMKLEAKLKLENLKLQEKDREKETKGEEEMECKRENEKEEKDDEKENKLKENRNLRKEEQRDNRSTQEAADMYELKETGHTPELTTEHDGRKVPVKRQTAANRKPPLQKSRSQEAESRQQSHSERFTSSFCSTHTLSLPCSPVEATRRVRAIHSQSQPDSTDIQATPPPSMIDMSLSDVQGEMQETGQQDALAGGLSETELQQQETMTEGSLSNDEYDCVSPDDISLPPMAETPESFMVQSDIEEGLCFSSHSAHISQYNQHYRAQSEHSGSGTAAGAVRQQRESSQAEGCPSPPTSLHNSTRFRSESSSFIQGPLPAPAATVLTSTVCSILRTEKISKDNKDCEVPEQRSPSKTELHCGHYNQPQRSTGNQGKSDSNVTSKSDTEPTPHLAELSQSPGDPKSSCSPQPCNDPDTELHKDYTPPQNTQSFSKCATISAPTRSITCKNSSFTQSFPDSETVFDQDIDSSQTRKEKTLVCKPQKDHFTSTNTVTQQTIYVQSSLSDTYCTLPQDRNSLSATHESLVSQCKNSPQAILIHQAGGFAQSPSICKDNSLPQDSGLLKCSGPCLQTSTTLTQIKDLPQSHPDSRGVLDLKVPSSQTSKETSSVNMPQSHTTAPTVIQQTVSCPPPPSDSHCNTPQASSTLRSKQESSFSQCRGNIPNVHASNRFSSKQCHQTVYSHHECLTSTCAQQCVHDHGMTPSSPAKPAAPPQPETQTQALAPQVNPHVRLPSSPPHLLTSDQDPDICQPMFIREEIRLTPQIQGPPLPGPPQSQAQAESLPQGKASKPGPPFFTRPLSRATVMEGSPVTLEVEVTGHHEPTLTWFKDGDVSAISLCRALVCEDRKHFLFNPEASDSDGGACEARAAVCHDSQRMAGNISDGGDRWLVAEVLDIMGVDWLTWFGTLCVLLWLLYLIIL